MKPVQYTVRLPVSLDKAFRALPERHGVGAYQRSVKAGVAALTDPVAPDTGRRVMLLAYA